MQMGTGLPPQLWFAPAAFGLLLVMFGVLVLLFPWILNFVIAGVFIFAGMTMIGVAWSARTKVTYRRFNDDSQ